MMSDTTVEPVDSGAQAPADQSPAQQVPDNSTGPSNAAPMVRGGALLLGVLALATAFIAVHAGVLRDPVPRDLPVAVAKGDATAASVLGLVQQSSTVLKPHEYPSPDAAATALRDRAVYAVVATDPRAGTLVVTTASAGGPAAADAVVRAVQAAAAGAELPVQVTDAVPVSHRDPRGLVPFYLVVGLVLGGFLAATALGLSAGAVPHTQPGALVRIGALLGYAMVSGLAGAVIGGGRVLDVWGGHTAAVALAGALVVFATAVLTAAVQGWLGVPGAGLLILLLVVLGIPGAGGSYPPEFLPGAFRTMHLWNPSGLGLDLIRGVASFDHRAIGWPLTALTAWAAISAGGLLRATARHRRRAAARRDAAQR